MPAVVADVSRKGIQVFTLLLGDFAIIVMMWPGGNDKKATLGASVKLAAARLLVWGETVFNKDDEGVTGFKCGTHHFFFSRADTG